MALFSSDNSDQSDAQEAKASSGEGSNDVGSGSDMRSDNKPAQRIDNSRSDILIRPYITEKATHQTDDGVYTFVVKRSANKPQIKQAIKDVYGVQAKKVRTAKLPKKHVRSRSGETGTKGGGKKAFVYLKEGDSIELM